MSVEDVPASVEVRRRPALRGRPVVVAAPGATRGRGAIMSVSPEARRLGLEPGMALAAVTRPDVIVLPLDRAACRSAAREIAAALHRVPGRWEHEAWGEASVMPLTDDVGEAAAAIQRLLFAATGLTCSIGIGENALQARVAAGMAAPSEVVELDSRGWRERVGPLPPDVLTAIGPKRRQRLHELEIERVDELAATDEPVLVAAFGPSLGPRLRRVARGENAGPRHGRARRPGREHRGHSW